MARRAVCGVCGVKKHVKSRKEEEESTSEAGREFGETHAHALVRLIFGV